MAIKEDPRPVYQQVAADLRARIMSGELEPDEKLATTSELMQRFDAANTTIQKAQAALKDEGYLRSRAGSGVYVRERKTRVVECGAYFDPATTGFTYSRPEVSEVAPPVDVREALGEDRAILRKRVMYAGTEPVDLSWSYYPASIAAGTALAQHKKIKGGAPAVLAELGYPQRGYYDRISTRQPTTEELLTLELPADVPVIRQFRRIHTDNDKAVEVTVMVKGGHLFELLYRQAASAE